MKARNFLSLLILFMAVSPAWGQIAPLGTTTTATTTSDTTLTITGHTVTAGTKVLVVTGGLRAGNVSFAWTSATWNGSESLTLVRADPSTFPGSGTSLWVLANPTAATANIVFAYTGTSGRVSGGATNYSGVDTATICEADNGTNGTGTSSSVSVATLTDNVWLVDAGGHRVDEARNQAGSETERYELQGPGGNAFTISSEDLDAGTAGAGKSMGWNWATSANFGQSLCALKPAAAVGRTRVTTIGGDR